MAEKKQSFVARWWPVAGVSFAGLWIGIFCGIFHTPIEIAILGLFPILAVALLIHMIVRLVLQNAHASFDLAEIPSDLLTTGELEPLQRAGECAVILGFEQRDRFIIQMFPKTYKYIYEHRTDPIQLCIHSCGGVIIWDFMTHYEPDISLSSVDLSQSKYDRPNRLTQTFRGVSFRQLLELHSEGHKFLLGQGLRLKPYSADQLRFEIQGDFKRTSGHRDWGMARRIILRLLGKPFDDYSKPIERQVADGEINIEELKKRL